MGEDSPNLDCDTQLDFISDEARRELLLALLGVRRGTENSVSLESLELDIPNKRVDFHHVHLPILSQHGIVEVIEPGKRVAPGENFDAIRPVLESLEEGRQESGESND